jgi:hypothetical protein
VGSEPDRRGDRVRGSRHRRGRLPRAGAELGGCFPPPPGYFERVREICDEYDVLLVSDEVICAFGRLGHMFAAERYGYQPDIVTCAKGLTSGYSPLGAMIATDRLFEPFSKGDTTFQHGYTFGGHPVSTAVAMANLDIFEREQLNEHVLETEGDFRATLEKLKDLRSWATSAGTGTSTGSSWSRTGTPRRRSTTPSPSASSAGSCPARCSRPGSTAGRRPRRPGRPARAAADLRPGALRRDGVDPARRPDPRRVAALADRPPGRRRRVSPRDPAQPAAGHVDDQDPCGAARRRAARGVHRDLPTVG